MSTTAPFTVEQWDRLVSEDDGQDHELLEGEHLVSPYPKWGHTELQYRLQRIFDAVLPTGCRAYVEAGYRLGDETMLKPDVSVASASQLKVARTDQWLRGSPLIAVEIVSPSNTALEIARKVKAFLSQGSQEVWVVYPEERQIHVHEPAGLTHRYENNVRSTVLPNLTLDLDELFRGLF